MITITKNGAPLDKALYDWNAETKVFSSLENGLTISTELHGCTFKTGYDYTFDTGAMTARSILAMAARSKLAFTVRC